MDYDYHPFTVLDTGSHGLVAHFFRMAHALFQDWKGEYAEAHRDDRGEEIPRGWARLNGCEHEQGRNELANRRLNNPIVQLEVCAEQSVVSRMVEFTCLLLTGLLRTQIERRCYVRAGPSAWSPDSHFRRLMGPEMHRVPWIFPILARSRAINLRPFNSFWIALLPPRVFANSSCGELLETKRLANWELLSARIPQRSFKWKEPSLT